MTITITPDTITNTITGILFLSASLWFVALAMKYIFEIVGSIITIISKKKNSVSVDKETYLKRWNREVSNENIE